MRVANPKCELPILKSEPTCPLFFAWSRDVHFEFSRALNSEKLPDWIDSRNSYCKTSKCTSFDFRTVLLSASINTELIPLISSINSLYLACNTVLKMRLCLHALHESYTATLRYSTINNPLADSLGSRVYVSQTDAWGAIESMPANWNTSLIIFFYFCV